MMTMLIRRLLSLFHSSAVGGAGGGDLRASLLLQYGVTPQEPTFEIVVDPNDAKDSSPIRVKPETVFNWNASEEEFRAFYIDKEILEVLENGRQIVRVYVAPGTEVEVTATRRPVAIDAQYYARLNMRFFAGPGAGNVWSQFARAATRFEDVTKVPGVTLTQIAPPRMAPPIAERLSDGEDIYVDHLKFQGARIVFQRFSYANTGFEAMGKTRFVNARLEEIAPPVYVAELGAFVLSEPGYGEAIISYPVKYQRWQVSYGIGAGVEFKHVQLAWLRGDITQCPMPNVMVLANATAHRRLAVTEFPPQVEPRGAYLGSWSFTGYEQAVNPATANLFTESGRTTQTVRVPNPDDPEQFIDIAVPTQITTVDPQGRPYTTKYQIPNG